MKQTPIAGIAMCLIKEGDKFVVLSDIMGDEDHLGDITTTGSRCTHRREELVPGNCC